MGLFDFLFGNKKKKEQEEQLRRKQEAEQKRQAMFAEIRKRQEEREKEEKEIQEQRRLQQEAELKRREEQQKNLAQLRRQDEERKQKELEMQSMEPFVFKSNCHQRYENGRPVMGLQECIRTVTVEKNTSGCKGYRLEPGKGFIVKIFNNDLNKPNMSDKPMIVVSKTDTSVELRGFPIEAQSPFGWQEVDYSDYGLMVYYEGGKVSRCVLHMYDRNIFIEYRVQDKTPLKSVDSNNEEAPCEQYAKLACQEAKQGNRSKAHQYGLQVYDSITKDPSHIEHTTEVESIALSLGKLMEGEYFTDNDSIMQAAGLAYYFLSRAINEGCKDPYLYVYRFSVVWEYNKAFYHIFAHAEGKELDTSPFSIFGQSAMMAYEHHLQGMQMADMLTEPRIAQLDPALGNIFRETYARYSSTPSEKIISLGNQYHSQVYSYLKQKVELGDIVF